MRSGILAPRQWSRRRAGDGGALKNPPDLGGKRSEAPMDRVLWSARRRRAILVIVLESKLKSTLESTLKSTFEVNRNFYTIFYNFSAFKFGTNIEINCGIRRELNNNINSFIHIIAFGFTWGSTLYFQAY